MLALICLYLILKDHVSYIFRARTSTTWITVVTALSNKYFNVENIFWNKIT